jgi:hypothetical protein
MGVETSVQAFRGWGVLYRRSAARFPEALDPLAKRGTEHPEEGDLVQAPFFAKQRRPSLALRDFSSSAG